MRIKNGLDRGKHVSFTFNEKAYFAYEGESVACALFAVGLKHLRNSPVNKEQRGMFCLMGSCQECIVWVDDQKRPSCQIPVTQGLAVRSVSEDYS